MLERYRVAALATEQSAADARPASQLVTALAEAWVETEGLRRQIVDVERAIAEREQLVAGYRKWMSDKQLRRVEARIAEIVRNEEAATDLDVRRLIEGRVEKARCELEFTQRARDRIDAVGSQLQQRAEFYADDVLASLNATIRRFARTLMTWADASIIYRRAPCAPLRAAPGDRAERGSRIDDAPRDES